MGYACPVCEIPQADARHLANHLAFTAMLGREDHREWLDEHAPGWEEQGEGELADRIEEVAKEVEFPQVFEDTAGGLEEHDHEHDHGRSGELFDDEREFPGHDQEPPRGGLDADAPMDEEAREILEEARELTRQMMSDEKEEEVDADAEDADESDAESDDA